MEVLYTMYRYIKFINIYMYQYFTRLMVNVTTPPHLGKCVTYALYTHTFTYMCNITYVTNAQNHI